jgi:hypothetical protein
VSAEEAAAALQEQAAALQEQLRAEADKAAAANNVVASLQVRECVVMSVRVRAMSIEVVSCMNLCLLRLAA